MGRLSVCPCMCQHTRMCISGRLFFTLSTFGRPWEKALRSLRRHHMSVHSSRDIRTRHHMSVHAERDSGLGSSPTNLSRFRSQSERDGVWRGHLNNQTGRVRSQSNHAFMYGKKAHVPRLEQCGGTQSAIGRKRDPIAESHTRSKAPVFTLSADKHSHDESAIH